MRPGLGVGWAGPDSRCFFGVLRAARCFAGGARHSQRALEARFATEREGAARQLEAARAEAAQVRAVPCAGGGAARSLGKGRSIGFGVRRGTLQRC